MNALSHMTAAIALAVLGQAAAAQQPVSNRAPITVKIDAQPLERALQSFAKQSGLQVIFPTDLARDLTSPQIDGQYSPQAALKMLLAGTQLSYQFVNERTVAIRSAAATGGGRASRDTAAAPDAAAADGQVHLVQVDTAQAAVPRENASGTAQQSKSSEDGPEVVVTGTRISGVGASPTSPVISIDREQILSRGYSSMEDVLRSLSMNFSNMSSSSYVNNNSGAPRFTDGVTAVNLRGLGTGATLVLVDGQRTVNSPTEDGTMVDISKIPVGMIERIDVITGAASSIYGGDAVAGVINIITRKDYEGSETFASFTNSGSNADSYEVRQMFGTGWGSGNLTANFNYQRHRPAETAALGITTLDQRSRGGRDYRDYTFTQPTQLSSDSYSGITIPGAPDPVETRVALLPAGNGRNVTTADLIYISAAEASSHTGNYNLITPSNDPIERYLTPDSKEYSGHLALTQHLADWLDLSLTATYSKRKSLTESFDTRTTEIIPTSNAFNHFGQEVEVYYSFYNEIAAGLMPALSSRSPSDSMGLSGSLSMKLPWKDWHSQLQLDAERAHNNLFRQQQASVYFGVGADEAPAAYAAIEAALNSSDPDHAVNLFGDGTGHGADVNLADFIYTHEQGEMESQLKSANLSFDGTVMTLPTGSLKAATGIEVRNESLDFSKYTLNTYSQQPTRDLKAIFGELFVPLMSGSGGRASERLLLQLAGRYDRYEISGPFGEDTGVQGPFGGNILATETRSFSEFSPQVGLRWQPSREVTMKANWAKAFQAPTIQNLFDPAGGFQYATFDPINPASNGGPKTVPFQYMYGGNPNLQPQTSKSMTLEFGYAPAAIPGLAATVDWNRVTVSNVVRSGVGGGSFSEILTNSALNPGVIRDANGVLQAVNFGPVNAASQHSEAIDLRVFYDFNSAWGEFSAGVASTYTLELSEQLTPASPVQVFDGRVTGPSNWRIIPSLLWSRGNWGANLYVNYDSAVFNTEADSPQRKIGSLTTVDTQVNWKLPMHGWRFALGAHNLFDVSPPFYDSSYGIDFSRYNAVGREVYFNAVKSFGSGAR